MPPPASPRVAVVGAGVLGLMSAWRLAQAGARVVVYEAEPDRPNASAVAAGMIAPAAECALEPPLREVAASLRSARQAWTAIAAELNVRLASEGTVFEAAPSRLAALREALERAGFRVEHRDPLWAPEDALLPSAPALAALRAAVVRAGGVLRSGRVVQEAEALVVDGRLLEADAVVVATGAPGRSSPLAPELERLTPLKGQLLRWRSVVVDERPTLRIGADVYLTVQEGEVTVGATVEPDRDDLDPQPDALERHRAEAESRLAVLRGLTPSVEVGVRADTPDGLPMVGPSLRRGVILATGARRNGWLWAPLVADIVTAGVLGHALGELAPLADRLHPGRFSSGEAT